MRLAPLTNATRSGPAPAIRRRAALVAPALAVDPKRPDLEALVAHYQAVLRLRDWEIVVSYVPNLRDSYGNEVWGLCYPCVDAKSATIKIRDPQTPPSGATSEEAAGQIVETIVHELVHLWFAPFGLFSPAEIAAEEQAVWALAPAIIRARGTADEGHIARAMLALAPIHKSRVPRRTPEKRMLDKTTAANAVKLLKTTKDPNTIAFLSDLLVSGISGEAADAGDGAADPAADPPAQAVPPGQEEEPKPRVVADDALAALGRTALALTGKADVNEAMVELARLATGNGARSAPAPKAAVVPSAPVDPDAVERKSLVARLVKINVETPATAWADSTATAPAKRLVDEPIAALRSRVETLESTLGVRSQIAPPKTPPSSTSGGRKFTTSFGEIELTAREVANAKARRKTPEEVEALLQDYAENKAGNEHARGVRKGA